MVESIIALLTCPRPTSPVGVFGHTANRKNINFLTPWAVSAAMLLHFEVRAFASGFLSVYRRNKRIAKTRAQVEHPFAQMRHMGSKLIRTIGQARAAAAMTMKAACFNLKRWPIFSMTGWMRSTRTSHQGPRCVRRGANA